jgi:hypothetical protein
MIDVILGILKRCWIILTAPAADPTMLWEVIPLVVTMFLMEIYFGKHKEEQLGWNTAFSNALVLLFVGTNLLRVLYIKNQLLLNLKLIVIIAMMVLGLLLAFLDFYQLIPRFIAFEISSKLPLNYLAYIIIVYIHTDLPLNLITLATIILLFIILVLIMKIIQIEEKPIRRR